MKSNAARPIIPFNGIRIHVIVIHILFILVPVIHSPVMFNVQCPYILCNPVYTTQYTCKVCKPLFNHELRTLFTKDGKITLLTKKP